MYVGDDAIEDAMLSIIPSTENAATVKLLSVHVTVPSTTVSPTTFPTIDGADPVVVPAVVTSHTVFPDDHLAHTPAEYAVLLALVVLFAPPA